MKKLLMALAVLLSVAPFATATTRTVKPSGGDFTTIAACSAASVAGDTCTVFAGTYAGWTQGVSGSSGLPITFIVNSTTFPTCPQPVTCGGANGDVVTLTSGVTVSSRSFITIEGFTMTGGGVTGNGTSSHNVVSYNTLTGCTSVYRINDSQGSAGSDNVASYNKLTTGNTGNCIGFYLYGDRNRIENNELIGPDGDCMDLGGANVVVRNNYCHDVDGAVSGQHIDFIQIIGGGTVPTLSFSLVEGNIERNCTNDGGNCHGIMIIRTGGPNADTIIERFNYCQNIDGDCINVGGVGDVVPNGSIYNNTCASEHLATYNTSFNSTQGTVQNTTVLNNIAYDVQSGGQPPFSPVAPGIENGNIAFTVGFSGSWSSPYSSESTYAALHNQNPKFVNYPSDAHLQAGSPAIGAGVALTTAVGAGVSSTTMTVVNSHPFQPGWAGTQGDWIRIGASTTVQISSIDYTNNILTLANAVSWNNSDSIYLYKNSSGTVVLNPGNPDVGAFPFVSGNTLAPPTNLQAIPIIKPLGDLF